MTAPTPACIPSSIKVMRILAQKYNLDVKGAHREEKGHKLCALPNIQKIIATKIYAHNYATERDAYHILSDKPTSKKRERAKGSKNKKNNHSAFCLFSPYFLYKIRHFYLYQYIQLDFVLML